MTRQDARLTSRHPIVEVLSKPPFVSKDKSYRIADIHGTGGDAIEILFRRNFINPDSKAPRLDQKLFSDCCPVFRDPYQHGNAALFEVGSVKKIS